MDTRVSRIVNRERGEFKKRKEEILNREKSETIRYKKYYDIDVDDTSIYDLVINTSDKTPDDIVNIVLKKLEK